MFGVDAFVVRGHEKVIDHYRRLRDSARSELERQQLQQRIDDVEQTLQLYLEDRMRRLKRAA
jgi:hypothetical protein